MIRSLSESLRNLLTLTDAAQAARFPELAGAAIKFDRPTDPFTIDKATINLYLFDIREDVDLRTNEPDRVTVNGKVAVRRPPLRMKCSYLVTAWPFTGTELELQQHRLLAEVLGVTGGLETIPAGALTGALVGQTPPPTLSVARSEPIRELTDVWSSIGNKFRPSLTLSSTIAIDATPVVPVEPVWSHLLRVGPRLGDSGTVIVPGNDLETFEVGGRVVDASAQPVAGATVSIASLGLQATTGEDGRFRLGPVPPGSYTLRGALGGKVGQRDVVLKLKTSETFDLTLTP